eukprot:COSAG06_NODE_2168_length_7425_cov_2.448403_4_plen_81_part_00
MQAKVGTVHCRLSWSPNGAGKTRRFSFGLQAFRFVCPEPVSANDLVLIHSVLRNSSGKVVCVVVFYRKRQLELGRERKLC